MTISEIEDRILAAVAAFGGQYAKRTEIAKQLGLKKLQPSEVLVLQLLTEKGLVEVQSVETKSPSKIRYEYRSIRK